MGQLCNACGIWLKRHGYPRPVQFFSAPAAAGTTGAAPAGGAAAAGAAPVHPQVQLQAGAGSSEAAATATAGTSTAGSSGREPPADVAQEFYLINGRPKRRRGVQGGARTTAPAGADAGAVAAGGPAAAAAGGDGTAGAGFEGGGAVDGAAPLGDPPINYEAAGNKVFVIRRKLLRAASTGSSEVAAVVASAALLAPPGPVAATPLAGALVGPAATPADGAVSPLAPPPAAAAAAAAAPVVAALVHFGWAPTVRAAHQMYDRVVRYGEASQEVAGALRAQGDGGSVVGGLFGANRRRPHGGISG